MSVTKLFIVYSDESDKAGQYSVVEGETYADCWYKAMLSTHGWFKEALPGAEFYRRHGHLILTEVPAGPQQPKNPYQSDERGNLSFLLAEEELAYKRTARKITLLTLSAGAVFVAITAAFLYFIN